MDEFGLQCYITANPDEVMKLDDALVKVVAISIRTSNGELADELLCMRISSV